MPGALVRQHQAVPKRSVQSLLVACGVPRARAYKSQSYTVEILQHPSPKSFWERHKDTLDLIGADAKAAFRRRAARVRPDLPGHEEQGRHLLEAWRRLRKLFARRGVYL